MRVLVTGGNGLVGRPVCEKFVRNGWDVRVIDLAPDCPIAGVSYAQCDILDFAAVSEQVEGCEAIVHLAAIPTPMSHPNPTLFNINVSGTYNIFEAADRAGIKRIAQASSINALGGYWGCDDRKFDYFPLDEAHPLHTTDAYSFSKQAVEDIAAYYWRRSGISSVSFRFPGVWSDAVIESRRLRAGAVKLRQNLDAFRQTPVGEQQARLADARAEVLRLRARRILEYDATVAGDFEREASDDWLFRSCFFDSYNYWTFIHTDDSTQALEKGLSADYEGAHPLFANSDINFPDYEAVALLSLFFPDVSRRSKPLQGAEALVDIARARDLIGFEPKVRTIL